MDLGIRNKVALVAGASSGLGRATATVLAREGAKVVIASRDGDRIQAAAREIESETGSAVRGVALDVRESDAGTRFVKAAEEAFGPPAILVTNAGGPPSGPFAGLGAEAFESALQLTFLSAVRMTEAALPAMKRARWGRIVHITSATVVEPSVKLHLSSAIRPAVAGFSKALSREVAGDGVTVNIVCPGFIGTERLRDLARAYAARSGRTEAEELELMGTDSPAGRVGTPEELGSAVAYLCSEQAAFITGVALRVDGGRTGFLL